MLERKVYLTKLGKQVEDAAHQVVIVLRELGQFSRQGVDGTEICEAVKVVLGDPYKPATQTCASRLLRQEVFWAVWETVYYNLEAYSDMYRRIEAYRRKGEERELAEEARLYQIASLEELGHLQPVSLEGEGVSPSPGLPLWVSGRRY